MDSSTTEEKQQISTWMRVYRAPDESLEIFDCPDDVIKYATIEIS